MASQNEGLKIGDVVKYEQDPTFSRETLVILDGETIVVGEALKNNGSDKYVATAAADAEVIALEAASPSGADGAAVCLVRNAVVDSANVTVASGTVADLAAALAVVNATSGFGRIIVRTGPTYTTL